MQNQKKLANKKKLRKETKELIAKSNTKSIQTKLSKKQTIDKSNNFDTILQSITNNSEKKSFPDINNFPE